MAHAVDLETCTAGGQRTRVFHCPIVGGQVRIFAHILLEALRRLQARLGDENIDDLIRLAYGSADFREGMAAFLGKRAPKWSGA